MRILLTIVTVLLFFTACGYKADPIYIEQTKESKTK
jgi:hypothetical protein